jgi:hypothetical protein
MLLCGLHFESMQQLHKARLIDRFIFPLGKISNVSSLAQPHRLIVFCLQNRLIEPQRKQEITPLECLPVQRCFYLISNPVARSSILREQPLDEKVCWLQIAGHKPATPLILQILIEVPEEMETERRIEWQLALAQVILMQRNPETACHLTVQNTGCGMAVQNPAVCASCPMPSWLHCSRIGSR